MANQEEFDEKLRIAEKHKKNYGYRIVTGGDEFQQCNYCEHVHIGRGMFCDYEGPTLSYCNFIRAKAGLRDQESVMVYGEQFQIDDIKSGKPMGKGICDAFCRDGYRVRHALENRKVEKSNNTSAIGAATGCLVHALTLLFVVAITLILLV